MSFVKTADNQNSNEQIKETHTNDLSRSQILNADNQDEVPLQKNGRRSVGRGTAVEDASC